MKKWVLLFLLLFSCVQAAEAKDSPKDKDKSQLPVSGGADFDQAKEAKKALDAAVAEASIPGQLKKEAKEVEKALLQLVKSVVDLFRAEPQRGDPKTDFTKSENRLHSKSDSPARASDGPRVHGRVDLSGWTSSSGFYGPTTYSVTYNYAPSSKNPFQSVVLVYDNTTNALISVTGYFTKNLSVAPDLSGFKVIFEAFRSDKTLAYRKYESEPSKTGGTVQVTLFYDSLGQLSFMTQTYVQPLDPRRVKFPE